MTIIFHKHHIIPKHMGGSDHPSNLLKCNIAMHAFLHQQLWKEHGHWQDYIAWKNLEGRISCQEAIRFSQILGNLGKQHRLGHKSTEEHKKKISNSLKGRKKSDYVKKCISIRSKIKMAKIWDIKTSKGEIIRIKDLLSYCRENNLSYQSMRHTSTGKTKQHKGYSCKKVEINGK